jgi:hypothetical protein
MVNNIEVRRVKNALNWIIGIITFISAMFATFINETAEKAVKSNINSVAEQGEISVFEVFWGLSIWGIFFFLAWFLKKIYEAYLNRRSNLDGWWIYGFEVRDADSVQKIVIGFFKLKHTIGGLTIEQKGHSKYFKDISDASKGFKSRGNWNAIEISNLNKGEELRILYDFHFTDIQENYEGYMHLTHTQKVQDFTNPKVNLLNIRDRKERFIYDGVVRDLSLNIKIFTNAFGLKLPSTIKNSNQIEQYIIENQAKIKNLISA